MFLTEIKALDAQMANGIWWQKCNPQTGIPPEFNQGIALVYRLSSFLRLVAGLLCGV
jgi:hypothetical protein